MYSAKSWETWGRAFGWTLKAVLTDSAVFEVPDASRVGHINHTVPNQVREDLDAVFMGAASTLEAARRIIANQPKAQRRAS